jgi:MarR-like DNA-binding transcriptional regulator SgrR of sgrS sRNA
MADLTPEQIAANEATALAETNAAELKAQNKTEAMRELSKELGINAFNPVELKAKFDEYNTWKTSQKSEQDILQEQLDSYKTKESEWQTKEAVLNGKLKSTELGISEKDLPDALLLAGNDYEKLADVIKKYPAFVSKEGIKIGVTDPNNSKPPTGQTEVDIYMAENYANNPYYKPKPK